MGSLALLKKKIADQKTARKSTIETTTKQTIGNVRKRTPVVLKDPARLEPSVTVCFTGHRPDKLDGYDWDTPKNKDIAKRVCNTVMDLLNTYSENSFTFIFGGALGIDQMAFEEVYKIKSEAKSTKQITLVLAMPFLRQDSKWQKPDRDRLASQISRADKVVYVDQEEQYKIPGLTEGLYHIDKMQKRNEYMVDRSSIVIAVWDGSSGGTGNCVKYAKGQNKQIIRIHPKATAALNKSIKHDFAGKGASSSVLPRGYTAIGRNELDKLMKLKEEIIKAGICSVDYETDGNPDDDVQDPQDHSLTMVSVAYQLGQAFCFPLAMDAYGANWDLNWFIENFLKPILEHPDVLIVIHNVKAEHGWSLLYGIDMFEKACSGKVMDTMLMVKALALPENTVPSGEGYEVRIGLKPATKALLADENGIVHGLMHVDDIKSFEETVGKVTWDEPIPGEFYKSGAKKGQPKTKKMARSRTFNELPVDQYVIDYSCSDSDWALGLYYKLIDLCRSEDVYDVLTELDVPRMMVLAEYELAGWHINKDRLKVMEDIANKALAELEPKLYEGLLEVTEGYADTDDDGNVIVPTGVYGMGEKYGNPISLEIKSDKPFNWGSIQHLQWLFFHVLKVSTGGLDRSKATGLPSTGKDSIDIIIERASTSANGNKFIGVLKEKRKYDKIKSTYVDGMLPYCREDTHKLHTSLNLVSTWRLSSKKPNLQNIPRADNDPLGIRGIFESPDYDPQEDYSSLRSPLTRPSVYINLNKLSGKTVFVGADYSQIELKVLAWYAGEQSMIETLAHGGDLHAKAAHDVFKLPCKIEEVKEKYKPQRYRAKKVNFGLVYGMTEYGLSKDPKMGMTLQEAKAFIDQYMYTYPGVREYQHDMIAFARQYGYVSTIFNHKRPIPEINHPNKWMRQKGENKAMNSPIQGSAADIIAAAMVNIRREAPSWLKPVIQIHDELMCETPVEYAAEGARIIKEIMERPIEGFSEIMPIIAEPYVGKIWQHALDVEWDDHGTPFVKPKHKRKEATDVLWKDIGYAMPYYKQAGIEVRLNIKCETKAELDKAKQELENWEYRSLVAQAKFKIEERA